ncbi:MAG: molybdopterin-dependent oxidoreductase [Nitrospinae bacterium]|nr:molybdopterin-dependent oxidoreductase [Nitrospinota bacterium]
MIKVTIDGIQVEVENGATILDAAKKAGVYIPTFCHDDRLAPTGACRICLVEIEGGPPRLFASCVTPAADKMVVKTKSEKIAKARKTNIELLLVHHPLDCPVCPAAGQCHLQDLTYEFGLQTSRFKMPRKEKEADISNPCIEQNDNRCVLCGKCIRVCNEIQGVGAIGLVKRGFNAYVGTPFQNELNCDFCGHCVTTCPVGARNSRFIMKGRAWNVKTVNSICSFCGTGCSISYDVRERENLVTGAKAVHGLGINGNFQCSKGWQGFQYIHSKDRLSKPLIRSGKTLSPVSWDDALEEVSKNLKRIIDEHGPQAVAGMGSERMSNEENYLFQKFIRTVVGSAKVDNILNMKNRAVGEGLPETLGGLVLAPLERLDKVQLIFLAGADATEESPVAGNMIRRAVTKLNAKLIVANSRNIRLGRIASQSLAHRVGTEAALVNGIIHEILTRNLVPREAAASRIENLEELRNSVSTFTPDYVERITGVAAAEISRAAEGLASSEGTAFLCGRDIIGNAGNATALEALKNLIILTGNGNSGKGGIMLFREFSNSQGVNDMGVTPNMLPGYQSAKDPKVREKFEKAWGKPVPEPGKETGDIIQQAIDGKIKALYIMGEDPVMRYPDGQKVREALGKIEFIICQDLFITETASYANVVLPGVSFAEKTGTFTNMEGRVQRFAQQISPLDEALPDLNILCKVAERMGAKLKSNISEEAMAEIAQLSPLYSGISTATGKGCGGTVSYSPGADSKGKAGIVSFSAPSEGPKDFPFTLVTGNLLHHLGPYSRKSEALNAVAGGSFVELSLKDMKELDGIKEGDMVLVESPHGRLSLPAKFNSKSPQGVAFIPNNFENAPVNILFSGNSEVTQVRIYRTA